MKMNKTNLEAVKDVAISFLYMPVEETDFSPIVVMHPIFETGLIAIDIDGKYKIVNIVENRKNLNIAIKRYGERIKNCKDVTGIYLIIRKSYRLTFLKFCENYLSIHDFSELLADAWVSSENPNQDANCSIPLLTKWFKKSDKRILMNDKDYKKYSNLPDTFTIYRGIAVGRNPDGLSWTNNYNNARWFAHRFDIGDKKGYIKVATAHKKDVLAYFNTRDENEIVININTLTNIRNVNY